ncbi:unnamed protein product [Hermetia illucens]|uniref:G-protein coupled receptors family 1 profile domain-containing protein n=1 Tax=Hermetia illucens TaxID=343691 RepID=A0A7R8UWS0_HERIL|nr:unnamed protein product [Hermetia illucens]
MIESQVPSGTNRIEADQAHKLPYYHEFDLSVLQRAIMSIAVIILTIFSIIGNVATLVVAIRSRKVRPLFRTCLFSLAFSDMISVMVTAVNYLTAFFSQIPQLWYLGPRLCHILPFFKIIGNLVNSATLVGISLDRYLSVRYAMKSSWEPGPKSCFLLAFAVWGVSIAIAVPSYTAYEHYQVNIIRTDKKNSSDPILVTTGFMCGAPKRTMNVLQGRSPTIKPEGLPLSLDHHPMYYKFDLPIAQRAILSITVLILAIFTIVGNLATLIVAIKSWKVRPLFRTYLVSLAVSDFISVFVTTLNYLSAFFSPIPQLWTLGPRLCHILPFLKIVGNLANSLTLVGISLDRCLSVRYLTRSSWEPGPKLCLILVSLIWGASVAIAVPSYTAYEYYSAYVIQTDKKNVSVIISAIAGYKCGALKAVNARYYMTLFCILFFPMVVAFIWFNSFLALDIWKRRKGITSSADSSAAEIQKTSRDNNKEGTTDAQAQSTTNVSNTETNTGYKQTRANRERRQLRMFCVVILLIITYMILKLPEWIFLIATFYSRSRSQNPWLMQFAFGIVSMGSSVTNPLLYAFVTQTIEYLQDLYRSCQRLCCILCDRGTRALSSVIILPEPISDIQQISGNGR